MICAASGVEVGTEQVWKFCEESELPRLIFVNKMDRENADYVRTVDGNVRPTLLERVRAAVTSCYMLLGISCLSRIGQHRRNALPNRVAQSQ